MNWGKSIVLAFVLFALFIGVLVVVCLRQDIPLVASDYYQQELVYQKQIDRITNTNSLLEKPVIVIAGRNVEIQFGNLPAISTGELILFRPSDERLDRLFKLPQGATSSVQFNIEDMPSGMYRARLTWTMDAKEYYLEEVIYL
jgi:hypothetical protein